MSVFSFFKVLATRVGSTAAALTAQLRGYGSTGADNAAQPVEGAEIVHPLGFASRPSAGDHTEALVVRIGTQLIAIAVIDKSVGRSQLAAMTAGSARVYSPNEPTAAVQLNDDGSIDVTSKTGTTVRICAEGQTADKPVAHEGSGTTGHTHSYALTAGPYAVTGTITSATDSIAAGQGASKVLVPVS